MSDEMKLSRTRFGPNGKREEEMVSVPEAKMSDEKKIITDPKPFKAIYFVAEHRFERDFDKPEFPVKDRCDVRMGNGKWIRFYFKLDRVVNGVAFYDFEDAIIKLEGEDGR